MLVLCVEATSTHECCINEGVSQSYVGKSVASLLSIPTTTMGVGEGQDQDPTLSTTLQPKVAVGKVWRNVKVRVQSTGI
jgi:hypothetical protein